MKLKGRVAIVTGGGTGQGRAIAKAMAQEGANVTLGSLTREKGNIRSDEITTVPTETELQIVAKEIEELGVEALAIPFDVTAQPDVDNLVGRTLDAFGGVDILVNAAGIWLEMAVAAHDDKLWQKVLDVNLTGIYRCTKAVLPIMMKKRWGRVINISSTAGNVGGLRAAAYCASKHGVNGFTRSVALEVAEYGITMNAICPTWVASGMTRNWAEGIAKVEGKTRAEVMADVEKQNPQKRLIQPEEIGHLAVFLATEEACGINGATIPVSGGGLW